MATNSVTFVLTLFIHNCSSLHSSQLEEDGIWDDAEEAQAALEEKRKGTDIVCPRLTVEGDEHITLLFVYVDGDNGPMNRPSDRSNFVKSLVTAEAMQGMCEVEQIVRNYRRPAPSYQAYKDCDELDCEKTCERETYWTEPGRNWWKSDCCASRKISIPAFLERPYVDMGTDDDTSTNSTWDPFLATEFQYRFPSDCSAFTDADADLLNELLYECAPYFEATEANLLNQCTVAAKIVARRSPNFQNEEYFWAFTKVMECGAEIPSKCLRGDGAGMMDSYLSLLPFSTSEKLKEGPYPVTIARTMVPVTGRQREHTEWKWEVSSGDSASRSGDSSSRSDEQIVINRIYTSSWLYDSQNLASALDMVSTGQQVAPAFSISDVYGVNL